MEKTAKRTSEQQSSSKQSYVPLSKQPSVELVKETLEKMVAETMKKAKVKNTRVKTVE